jgi:PDDEXK-like domain of unknown function (DUF3799)
MKIEKWAGHEIDRPGVYEGVGIQQYHSGRLCAGPSISSSGLRTIFAESERHFYDQWPLNKDRAEQKESEAFILGRAAHHLLLGEKFFAESFVVQPEEAPDGRAWSGNNKTCKEWLAEQRKTGKTVLTAKMIERIKGMAVALGNEPLVRAGALNGRIECTMAWKDEETGVWLLSRPDVIPTDSGDFVDLKTTTSVAYHDLVKTVGDYGYHQQGALVAEGYRALFGRDISSFSLYFIESNRPHCARLVQLKNEDLALGARQNRNALHRFVKAMNSGQWPGPGGLQETVQYIEMSDRMRQIAEDRIKFNGVE